MKIKAKYELSKSAKVGETCVCPSCGEKFVKSNYQQAFCKTKSGTECKDKYWNTVDSKKRNNTTRISPANLAWSSRNLYKNHSSIVGYSQQELDKEDRYKNSLEANSHHHGDVFVGRCEFCECIDCRCDN